VVAANGLAHGDRAGPTFKGEYHETTMKNMTNDSNTKNTVRTR